MRKMDLPPRPGATGATGKTGRTGVTGITGVIGLTGGIDARQRKARVPHDQTGFILSPKLSVLNFLK